MKKCELLYANLHTLINLTQNVKRETSLMHPTAFSRFTLDVSYIPELISGPVTRKMYALSGNPVPVFQLVICVCGVILIVKILTKDDRNLHSELQQSLIKRHASVEIEHVVDIRYNISSENAPV
jgi:hypothetical protein